VIAVCELAAVFPTSSEGSLLIPDDCDWPESELAFGDFSPGRFAWLLKNVRVFENPIPARGALSLWDWDHEALGLIDRNTMKKKPINVVQFRQGDVLKEAVRLLGDTTGAQQMTQAGMIVSAPAEVIHEEHATIALEPGKYVVRRQREYTPEAIRNVAD
jgi:hypothetical protein